MVVIIGLIGNAGVGKDTMADIIENMYPDRVIKKAFATPVKHVARELFQFSEEQLHGSLKEVIDPRWNITPREAFQIIGTNIMQFGIYSVMPKLLDRVPVREFWVYHFKIWFHNFIKDEKNKDKIIIVTDVRFQHEADMIAELKGTLIKIVRNIDMNDKKYNHLSENGVNDVMFDYLIENNGTIDEFTDMIHTLFY